MAWQRIKDICAFFRPSSDRPIPYVRYSSLGLAEKVMVFCGFFPDPLCVLEIMLTGAGLARDLLRHVPVLPLAPPG